MHQPFADLELKRDDLKRLYPRETGKEWVIEDGGFDWYHELRVRRDGIYRRDPDEGTDPVALSDAERAVLPQHPTDDFSQPLLKLPCTLGDFETFIDRYDLPAPDGFRLLEVVGERCAPLAQTDADKQADDDLDPRRRNSYLRVIAALMVRGKVESTDKPYEVADDLNVKLDLLGVPTLKRDTIASIIKEVRNHIDSQGE